MIRTVILDGGTTNPGDLSWEPITGFCETAIYPDTPPELVPERARGADCIVMNRIVMSREVLEELPGLRLVATLSTGYNTIDLEAAARLGVAVCNVPFYCVETVAQQALALLLELCNQVRAHSDAVRAGDWERGVAMSSREHPLFELSGKTLGIVGYGNIGRAFARLGRALGMDILAYSRHPRPSGEGESFVSLEELLGRSDVVSLHCALTEETRGLIDGGKLALMKPTAFLINTSRGAVVREVDLAQALNQGVIAGAGLDVMEKEPPEKNNPLLTARNCLITPHIGWSSRDARGRLIETVADNIRSFFAGTPKNRVN